MIEILAGLALVAALAVFFAAMIISTRKAEIRQWNDGFCACGKPWEHFDNDSQGGRGYKCRGCGAGMWISYNVDRRPEGA